MKHQPIYREPCGCKWRGGRWLELCPEHLAEDEQIHRRWAAEHAAHHQQRAATPPEEVS